MKITTIIKRSKRITLTTILCSGSLLLNACTTQNTAYLVQTQPMNPVLERQILRETGLSGMAIGAGLGAVVGGAVGALYGVTQHHDKDQLMKDMVWGAGAGGVYGAGVGHRKGIAQGQGMVSSGINRDKARQLVKAAQQENQRLAAFNAGLSKKISSTKAIKDTSTRKIALSTLKKQAESYKQNSDSTIAMRAKALQNKSWGEGNSAQRNDYVRSNNEQIESNKALAKYINQVSELQSTVY